MGSDGFRIASEVVARAHKPREPNRHASVSINLSPAPSLVRNPSLWSMAAVTSLQAGAGNRAVSTLLKLGLPVQRVGATVFVGTGASLLPVKGSDEGLGRSVSAYADHAERKAWSASKSTVSAKAAAEETRDNQLDLLIAVDKGICHHCQAWMENSLLGVLRGWDVAYGRTTPSRLFVEVTLKKKGAVRRQVLKGATNWDGISYTTSIRSLSHRELKNVKGEAW